MSEFLKGLGLNKTVVGVVIQKHQTEKLAEEAVKKNPYSLMDIRGVGFLTADVAAQKLGVKKDSVERINRAIETVLKEEANSNGNAWVSAIYLQSLVSTKLQQEFTRFDFSKYDCARSGEKHFLKTSYYTEKDICDCLVNFSGVSLNCSLEDWFGKGYDHAQLLNIKDILLSSELCVLTGGAGTGKTTILRGVIDFLKSNIRKQLYFGNNFDKNDYSNYFCVGLIAPTGKAAQRLKEVTGVETFTIHRYLKMNKQSIAKFNGFTKLGTDFLIVDECSMINSTLLKKLLIALNRGVKILFVGDYYQLSPIGLGAPFKDIIKSKRFNVFELNKIYRSDSYEIAEASNLVRNGKLFNFNIKNSFDLNAKVQLIPIYDNEALAAKVVDIFDDTRDQILIAMKNGLVGTENINMLIAKKNKEELSFNNGVDCFKVGDRVINTVNNYELWVMNGEIGVVDSFDDDSITVNFLGELKTFDKRYSKELLHAWAITVHKSQGSEFDSVILPLSKSHSFMLNRNLLYTAITRAKKRLIMVGDEAALVAAINNNKEDKRNTFLLEMLKNE